GTDAIEAKRAIHVARLARQKQMQLAAGQWGCGGVTWPAANAIFRLASRTDRGVARFNLPGRHERLHEVELADRTDVLAKRSAPEKPVDNKRPNKIADDDPRGQPRAVPQGEDLIRPQEDPEQQHCEPFVSQPAGPGKALREDPPGEHPREHEGAGHAE